MLRDTALDEIQEKLKAEGIKLDDVKDRKKEETQEHKERELSAFEQEQMKKGWKPDGKKSAEEWAKDGDLAEQVKSKYEKKIQELEASIKAMREHVSKQDEVAYKKALEDLQKQKAQAISNRDAKAVEEIEKQQKDLEKNKTSIDDPGLRFQAKYADLLNDMSFEAIEIQQWVFERDKLLGQKNLPPDKHVQTLEEHMLKKFPNYFNKSIDKEENDVNIVESASSVSDARAHNKNKKFTINDLNPVQRELALKFERHKVMKVDEYIQQLVKSGDLK